MVDSHVSLVPVTLRPASAITLGAPVAITSRGEARIEVRNVGAETAAWVARLLVVDYLADMLLRLARGAFTRSELETRTPAA